MPVLRRRAAGWCLRNDLPEAALEYSIAAGDVDTAVCLVEKLFAATYRQGRVTTLQRWYRWLEDRGGIEEHPMATVWASMFAALTGRPVEAERWADAVDRWQNRDAARPDDPHAEAWAATLRALLCRRGVEQMLADADEAVRRFAAAGIVMPLAVLMQGLARVLSGDLDGGDASLADAVSAGEQVGGHEALAGALCERALLAMARGEWSRAEVLAVQARTALQRAGIEDLLDCAVQARVALHRGDAPAVRQELVSAQRVRHLLTYALPSLGRSGPDRAHPRPLRARRPDRCQDADAGDR